MSNEVYMTGTSALKLDAGQGAHAVIIDFPRCRKSELTTKARRSLRSGITSKLMNSKSVQSIIHGSIKGREFEGVSTLQTALGLTGTWLFFAALIVLFM